MKCANCNASVSPGDRFCGECGQSLSATSSLSDENAAVSVILIRAGSRKIQVISEIRNLAGLRLKQAKDLVETAPNLVRENVSKQEGEQIKAKLESLGATVELK